MPKLKESLIIACRKLDDCAKHIIILQKRRQPIQDKLNEAIKEKDKIKASNKKILLEMKTKLDSVKLENNNIQRCTKELDSLEEHDLFNEINKLKESLKKVDLQINTKDKEICEMLKEIEKLKDLIQNQESNERDLNDNRELIILKQKVNEFQKQEDELLKSMGHLDFAAVQAKRNSFIKKRESLQNSKGQLIGQKGEIINQIDKLKKEINLPNNKDAIKNYRKKFYEVEILKKVILDLGQYRTVLEYALMKFHSEKMETINRLIREFWRQIYKGNDIDYIKIQTDAESTGAGSADKKRNYNYRVVQSKNRNEIDMRGRCSAGQRVLACLIIRMALAETFSTNCGVLALDEPTTNLDRDNIRSLCDALNRLISDRKAQQNFMLIVITHDEEFLSILGRIQSYYKIERNYEGKSEIRLNQLAP